MDAWGAGPLSCMPPCTHLRLPGRGARLPSSASTMPHQPAWHSTQPPAIKSTGPPRRTCALGMTASTSSTNSSTGSLITGGSSPPAGEVRTGQPSGTRAGRRRGGGTSQPACDKALSAASHAAQSFKDTASRTPAVGAWPAAPQSAEPAHTREPPPAPATSACRAEMVARGSATNRVSTSTARARASVPSAGSSWRRAPSQPRGRSAVAAAALAEAAGPTGAAATADACDSGCCSREAASTSVCVARVPAASSSMTWPGWGVGGRGA